MISFQNKWKKNSSIKPCGKIDYRTPRGMNIQYICFNFLEKRCSFGAKDQLKIWEIAISKHIDWNSQIYFKLEFSIKLFSNISFERVTSFGYICIVSKWNNWEILCRWNHAIHAMHKYFSRMHCAHSVIPPDAIRNKHLGAFYGQGFIMAIVKMMLGRANGHWWLQTTPEW